MKHNILLSAYFVMYIIIEYFGFLQFQSESRRALDILQHEFVDSFDVLFMKSIPLVTRYDNFFL